MTYDNYDYAEAFQKQIDNLEEWEIEQLIKEKKIPMVYRTTTTKAGDQLEVDIYPSFTNRKDIPRTKRGRESKPSQKNLNNKRAKRYLGNLVAANFDKGDLWGTFTYDTENIPSDMKDAQKLFRNFIRRINYRRKKRGQANLKYVFVTEYSEDPKRKTRVNHHMIFSGECDRDEIEEMWTLGTRTETKRLTPDKDTHLAGLVSYITKDPKGCKSWTPSKGLKKPTITRNYSKFKKSHIKNMANDFEYTKEILEKKYLGYKFIDTEICINDINAGFYVYARMCRVLE